jgi:hypothetical protein
MALIVPEGKWLLGGDKKGVDMNFSSLFQLRSQSGSDGLGTLTDRAIFTWKSKQYRFVFPKVVVA